MRNKVGALVILVCLITLGSFGHKALAANSQLSKVSLRPFLEQLQLGPTEATRQFQLTVNNDSSFSQIFHLSAVNFGSLNESGGLAFEGANSTKLSGQYGLAKWLSLDQNDIELGAGKQTTVKVTINNGSDLSPGAHYAAVIVTASKTTSAPSQLTITPKISSLVFITKIGGEKYDIHLESVDHNGSLFKTPSIASVRLRSTGNTYIVPRGIVSLKQDAGVISRGVINGESSIVLPGTVRNFDVPLSSVRKIKNGFFFTKYKIQVDYRYDGNSNFATHSYDETLVNKSHVAIALLLIIPAIGLYKLGPSKLYKRLSRSVKA
jgi:hypothetical protein